MGALLRKYLISAFRSSLEQKEKRLEAYQADLAGEPRVVLAQRDASGQPLYGSEQVLSEGIQGSDLSLTIHAGLQVKLEEEIFSTWVADRAKKVSAVVMDPYTGEIYAQASYPSYDANDFRAVADEDPGRFVDPVVAEPYEPGSVMKMMTATPMVVPARMSAVCARPSRR